VGWLAKRIKENGIAVSDCYCRSRSYFDLTPAGRSLINTLDPLIRHWITGRVLDAGAGRLTYTDRLSSKAERVVSFDRFRVRDGLDTIGDLAGMPFSTGSFDSIFCSQVLEHVPEPLRVLSEFARILRPGGVLVLSVPHLAHLHNEPHDYFRYTEFGLRHLLKEAGLEVEEFRWSGGLLSFLGHLPSTLVVNFCWGIPIVFPIVFQLNRLWSRGIAALESRDTKSRRFALNIVVVARST